MLAVAVVGERELRFADGRPVRAASAVAALGDGWLIAQDDATHAAWEDPRSGEVWPLRLFPPVSGHDLFSEDAGTKRLKPDLESACPVPVDDGEGVLLLGSGSLPTRTRAVVVHRRDGAPVVAVRDLAPVHARVRDVLGLVDADVNLEGACVVGDVLRWFQRGIGRRGVPSASVDLPLAATVAAVRGDTDLDAVTVTSPRRYDLGELAGVALAVTDAVTLPDQRVLVSATAEDTADAVADGPVSGSALALLDGDRVVEVTAVPGRGDTPYKVEGLAIRHAGAGRASVLAVVDQDDPATASVALDLDVRWAP